MKVAHFVDAAHAYFLYGASSTDSLGAGLLAFNSWEATVFMTVGGRVVVA